ncbi:hypothetical protein BJ165DRAFT_1525990 [Panaeolus papilionaceus]|nr:hypothetical protein BJ165DRAFT_1525990 [Panaeolus papilionaceus]
MPSSYRPQTLPPFSSISPRANTRISSHQPRSEIVCQAMDSEAIENPPCAPEVQENGALSSFTVHPLSDVRTNLDTPTTSPNPANIPSLELNVNTRPSQDNHNIQKQSPSSFVRNYQGSNTRRKRKARDEELRQATLWHPAQDQNVGPHSGFRDSESLISGTPLRVNKVLLAEGNRLTDTQTQQSKDHHAEASHASTSNTASGRQQPDISLPTARAKTTDQAGQSIAPVGNKHLSPAIQTSTRGSPSRTIDRCRQDEFDRLSSQGLSHVVMRKNGAGAILSIKPKKEEELDEEAEADELIKQYTPPKSSLRMADTVVSKPEASNGKRKEQQSPNMGNTKVDANSATTPQKVIQDGCQPPKQSTTMLLGSERSFATPPSTQKPCAERNGANTPSHLKSDFDKRSPIQVSQSPAPYPSPIVAELGPDLFSRKTAGASTPTMAKPTVPTAAVKSSKRLSPSDIIREVLKSHRTTFTEVGHASGNLSRNDIVDEQKLKGVTQPSVEGRAIVVFRSTAVSLEASVHDTTHDDGIPSESSNASIDRSAVSNDAPRPMSPSLCPLPPSPSDRSEPEEIPYLHGRLSHAAQTPLAPFRDTTPSPPSFNTHRRASPDPQITPFDDIYSEELQSVSSAPLAPPQPALPWTVCRVLSPEEASWPVPDESIGTGPQRDAIVLQRVFPPSAENPNTSQVSKLGRSYGWVATQPSSVSLDMSESIIIQDAPMLGVIFNVDGAVPVLDESIGMAEMEVEVEAQVHMDIVDSPMTILDGDDAGVTEIEELMAALSISDLHRDVSPDTEMLDVSFEDDDVQMDVEEASIAAPPITLRKYQKTPPLRPIIPIPKKVGRSGTRNQLAPAPAKPTPAVESPRVIKGTGPPKRGLKTKVVETKLDRLLSGVGFVPTYPNGTPFRIEKCFHWPMDTTPDPEFTGYNGGSLTDESMDWTSTNTSSDSDDVEMEDLTCPDPLVFNTSVLPPTAPMLHERALTQQISLTPPIAIPTINVAPLPAMPSQPFVQEHSGVSISALALNIQASQQEEPPSITTAPREVPATAELSAEAPKPEPREVHAPSPDVRTSGGGTYNSLGRGDEPMALGLRCRKVPKWSNLRSFLSDIKTTQPRPRGRMPTGPPPSSPSEIRAHLSPYRITPPPRATPQPAAADPKPALEPTQASEHAALITTVQPVAPELKYTRECSFPVPHGASHSAVTTPSERTAAHPLLHNRLSSAATIERAAAPGPLSNIPEENDQEGHSLVIDTRLGKKVKSSARKSRKAVEKKSKRDLVSREPEMAVSVPQDVIEPDPLTHATRWGVEEGSFIATLYAEVSAVHNWLRRNPWYLFEWYMIMLALLFTIGNRFFVTSVLLSVCVDPWLVYFRGIFSPISASVYQ